MINVLAELERALASGQKTALARIIRQVGSAPRALGAKMLVMPDGSLVGTIGGGLLEHAVILKAREVLSSGKSTVLDFEMTGQEVAASDMLCGGSVSVYIEAFSGAGNVAHQVFRQAAEIRGQGRRGALVTVIAEGMRDNAPMLVTAEGMTIGDLFGPRGRIPADAAGWANPVRPRLVPLGNSHPQVQVFIEPIESDAVLYLFGAGHVSTFVAALAKVVDFRISVIDDRAEFANRARFPAADEILVCDFVAAFQRLQLSPPPYVAILTRGHTHDQRVLRAALQVQPQPAYIGMIGSLRKRDLIYRSLLEEGLERSWLERVHCPIGAPIRAESPEEIAVSIVAELIRVRAQSREQGASAAENLQ
jgi:xanthine dehydrogenase accessory factor